MFPFGKPAVITCPFCYIQFKPAQTAFRCSGRGLPGRAPCVRVADPIMQQQFSDSRPYMPIVRMPAVDEGDERQPKLARDSVVCDDCGGETQVRVCPNCHSTLPRNLDANSPMFGMVGARNSGKTVMLSILQKELLQNVARRFAASIDCPGGSAGLALELSQNQDEMANGGGHLPGQTAAAGAAKHTPAVYEWSYTNVRHKLERTIFSFYDTAGEDVANVDNALTMQYLSVADGVIILLDPFSFPANVATAEQRGVARNTSDSPEMVLDAITTVLQTAHAVKRNKKIKVPVAVVVSKIDAFFDQFPEGHPLRRPAAPEPFFNESESASIHDHMTSLVAGWGGDSLLRKLDLNYERWRLFGVSALGAEPDYASGMVNGRGVLPIRVAEPLLWLLARQGFIPTR